MENDNLKLDALVIRLRGANSDQLTSDLQFGGFNAWQIPYVEAWIKRLKEEERNAPVTLYHRRKAPAGKLFKTSEVPDLEKKGWVDSPDKFSKTLWQKLSKVPNPTSHPSTNPTNNENNWQDKVLYYIAVGVIIAVLAMFIFYLIKKHFGIPL